MSSILSISELSPVWALNGFANGSLALSDLAMLGHHGTHRQTHVGPISQADIGPTMQCWPETSSEISPCYSLLLQIAVLISIGFVGCWTPYGIVSLWSVYRPGDSIPPEVSMLPCLFAETSTIYNPFIYYVFSKNFKREVNQLSCLCRRSNIRTSDAKIDQENTLFLVCDPNKSKPGAGEQSFEKSKENETQLMANQ